MTKIGFHYFHDTQHYRQSDLNTWLPALRKMRAKWLVLEAPLQYALPEHLVRSLVEAGIQPVLHFKMPPDQLPLKDNLQLLFITYARWGGKYIALFDRPNLGATWQNTAWAQADLVERFLDIFIPLSKLCIDVGLTPIFPPLEPGGDYWDTAFLRAALQGIQRRGHQALLEKMVIGAYAHSNGHPLNWGAGGPERWPEARPYQASADQQDQRGARIFDWYKAITNAILPYTAPIFLFGIGMDQPDQKNVDLARLLVGENLEGLEALPEEILGTAFDLQAWFSAKGEILPLGESYLSTLKEQKKNIPPISRAGYAFSHYLLLPAYDWGIADFHLEVIQPFIKKYQPTIGFSLQEAAHARRVTVIGNSSDFPKNGLQKLRNVGAIVEHIEGDGTILASRLASALPI
ncbi:MAG: hypothetical protein IMY76_05690 [Chloroflexi bacterium]|nr:hypothetical protein [Chloroflexota bacterium]